MDPHSSADLVPEENEEDIPWLSKLKMMCSDQPMVPVLAAATCGALYFSGKELKRGNSSKANMFFRWRIALQGATVLAIIGYSYLSGDLDKFFKNTLSRDEKERIKSEERKKLWLEELERDHEENLKRKQRAIQARLDMADSSKEFEAEAQELRKKQEALNKTLQEMRQKYSEK